MTCEARNREPQAPLPPQLPFLFMPKPAAKLSGDSPAIDQCVRVFRSHLHLPDCSAVFAALGAVCANYLTGDPVWLMLVGAPSTGKTVIVKACSRLPDCREASDSHNSSAFLTWDSQRGLGGLLSPPRVEHGEQTGGIGDFGIIVYPEFSSVLSLPPDARIYINSVHRKIYDGQWKREFGSGGGRTLTWEGKAGALGAVTPAIDRHSMSSELGERWLYFRFPEPDLISQANSALNQHSEGPADRNNALTASILDTFTASKIERGLVQRKLNESERTRMARVVAAACTLRGSVARDHHHRDIIDLPQREGAGRILSALTSIYLALELLGLRNAWCWKIVRKIALDCAPGLRTQFVRCAMKLQMAGIEITSRNVYPMLPLSSGVLSRVLEDVRLLGILTHDGGGDENGGGGMNAGIWKVMRELEEDQ